MSQQVKQDRSIVEMSDNFKVIQDAGPKLQLIMDCGRAFTIYKEPYRSRILSSLEPKAEVVTVLQSKPEAPAPVPEPIVEPPALEPEPTTAEVFEIFDEAKEPVVAEEQFVFNPQPDEIYRGRVTPFDRVYLIAIAEGYSGEDSRIYCYHKVTKNMKLAKVGSLVKVVARPNRKPDSLMLWEAISCEVVEEKAVAHLGDVFNAAQGGEGSKS